MRSVISAIPATRLLGNAVSDVLLSPLPVYTCEVSFLEREGYCIHVELTIQTMLTTDGSLKGSILVENREVQRILLFFLFREEELVFCFLELEGEVPEASSPLPLLVGSLEEAVLSLF